MTCSGYSPPEYVDHRLITKKFDIFGLGVIIAKLMAGRERYSEIDYMTEKVFTKHVRIKSSSYQYYRRFWEKHICLVCAI